MFRSIGELAFEMLAKLEIDGTATRGSNARASGRSTAVKGVARPTGVRGGLIAERAFAQGGEVAAEQTELGKGTGANPGQLGGQEERQSENGRANKGRSSTFRLFSSKDGRAHVQRVAPLGARPSLVLVSCH